MTASHEWGTVERIESVDETQRMYNLTVDEAHTFFVGDGQWLVHNAACDDWWFSGDLGKEFHKRKQSAPETSSPWGAYIMYDPSGTTQVALYNEDGLVIVHIDAPDGMTLEWHYHEMTIPGDASSGHGGADTPHPRFADGTLEGVLNYLMTKGLAGYDLSPP